MRPTPVKCKVDKINFCNMRILFVLSPTILIKPNKIEVAKYQC